MLPSLDFVYYFLDGYNSVKFILLRHSEYKPKNYFQIGQSLSVSRQFPFFEKY